MNTIYVAGGVGVADTKMASYDAALADANLHNYNLVAVSSVVPEGATVERVDVAPDLGPAGNALTVVEARRTVGPVDESGPNDGVEVNEDEGTDGRGDERVVAGLGWATGPGPGLFYEVTGEDPEDVRERIRSGLDGGSGLREWKLPDREIHVEAAAPVPDAYTTAVVLAAFGESTPIL